MKTSTALARIKTYLPPNEPEGLCFAAMQAYQKGEITPTTRQRVCEMITRRIEPFAFATMWLAHAVVVNRVPKPDLMTLTPTEYARMVMWRKKQSTESIQAWRHAWLDQMIAEFKAKGD